LRNYAVFDVFNPKIQILEQHVFAEYQKKSWEKVKWWNVFTVAAEDVQVEINFK
jgi:hypothetical protein